MVQLSNLTSLETSTQNLLYLASDTRTASNVVKLVQKQGLLR